MRTRKLALPAIIVAVAVVCLAVSGPVLAAATTLISPVGGDVLMPGVVHRIRWTVDPQVNGVMLNYSTNGGATWTRINKYMLPNPGQYDWTVPDVETQLAKIKLEYWYVGKSSEPARIVISGNFSITRGWYGETKLLGPNGGERLNPGEVFPITWISTPAGGSVVLEYSTDGGNSWTRIARRTNPGTGVYAWTVPEVTTNQARIKVWRQVGADPPLYKIDVSDDNFMIGTIEPYVPPPFGLIPVFPVIMVPVAPTDLEAVAMSDVAISLTWTDNSNNESGFKIYRDGTEVGTVAANVWSFVDSGLAADTAYRYVVKAHNLAGTSSASNEASARTQAASQDEEPTLIRLQIDNTLFHVDGVSRLMDAPPMIKEGRTMLPIRFVAEPLGATVGWDPVGQKATVALGERVVELWIGNSLARVNGANHSIDPANPSVVPIVVPPGRTMLPLRFIAEALGCKVEWDPGPRLVMVTYPAP